MTYGRSAMVILIARSKAASCHCECANRVPHCEVRIPLVFRKGMDKLRLRYPHQLLTGDYSKRSLTRFQKIRFRDRKQEKLITACLGL